MREEAWSGLWAALEGVPNIVTRSRILRHWQDVPAVEMPAMHLQQGPDDMRRQTGLPQQKILTGNVFVYVSTEIESGISPAEVLNPILDAIESIFVRNPMTGRVDFDIEEIHEVKLGQIATFEGTLGNREVAIVPVSIIINPEV
jgi:hypothetical protein